MKVTDLMIGDWVTIKDENKHGKVTQLCVTQYMEGGEWDEELCVDDLCEKFSNVSPVPLTQEILDANGFKLETKRSTKFGWVVNEAQIGDTYIVIHTCEKWVHAPKKYINIWVKWDGYVRPSDYHLMYPEYVHELQHALRICGLNEIADNFKVEP